MSTVLPQRQRKSGPRGAKTEVKRLQDVIESLVRGLTRKSSKTGVSSARISFVESKPIISVPRVHIWPESHCQGDDEEPFPEPVTLLEDIGFDIPNTMNLNQEGSFTYSSGTLGSISFANALETVHTPFCEVEWVS